MSVIDGSEEIDGRRGALSFGGVIGGTDEALLPKEHFNLKTKKKKDRRRFSRFSLTNRLRTYVHREQH